MKKCRQKTWLRILAFTDAIWFRRLQIFTTDQPLSPAFKKTFAFLVYAKNFFGLVVFGKKAKKKQFYSLVGARIFKNNLEIIVLAGKILEAFNFISFFWVSMHFHFQFIEMRKKFCLKQSLFISWLYAYKPFCLLHQALTFTY